MTTAIQKIIDRVRYFGQAVQDDENRLVVAKDIIDRLFISNYFTNDKMANLIKNELASIFGLTEEQVIILLKEYEEKCKLVNDKIQIERLKRSLQDIPIYENEHLKSLNLVEVKKIVKYILENITIYNKHFLQEFVLNDLCNHFLLGEEDKRQIEEVLNSDKC